MKILMSKNNMLIHNCNRLKFGKMWIELGMDSLTSRSPKSLNANVHYERWNSHRARDDLKAVYEAYPEYQKNAEFLA